MQTTGPQDSPLAERLILVIGARRSGTHWLGRIIGSQPEVAYLPSETYLFSHVDTLAGFLNHGSMGLAQVGWIYVERDVRRNALRSLCDAILVPYLTPGKTRILERTPQHTANLDLIADLYPSARIVHIIRDGRDVARSLGVMPWGPKSVVAGAEEWVKSVSEGRRPMKHYHEVRYEELVADPRREVARIFEMLELPTDESYIDAALIEAEMPVNTTERLDAPKQSYADMAPRDLAAVERIAGELLVELGYELAPRTKASRVPRVRVPSRASLAAAARRIAPSRAKTEPTKPAPGASHGPAPTYVRDGFEKAQQVADQFLDYVRSGARDKVRALLDPRIHIQLWTRNLDWEGRGDDAVDRMLDVLSADPVVTRPHIRSDLHAALPALTIVFAAELDDGPETRTLVLHIRRGVIFRVAFYGLG